MEPLKIKNFPLTMPAKWLDRVGKAANKAGVSKHDFIVNAANKEMDRLLGEEK